MKLFLSIPGILVIILLECIPVVAIVLWQKEEIAGPIILGLYTLYLFASLGTVKADQVGALFLFGEGIIELSQGLYFAPLGFFKVVTLPSTVFQDELPADPELIYDGDGDKVPEGFFPPIRILFGPPDPKDKKLSGNPYNVAMVTRVTPIVSWRIKSVVTFINIMGNIENCRKNLSDLAEGICTKDFTKMTPAKAMQKLGQVNANLKNGLVGSTTDWGITLYDAYVKPFQFSHKLNSAVVDVPVSEQKAQAYENEQEMIVKWKKKYLIDTGLAKIDAAGNISELVPDANVRISAEALKELSKLEGTLVLGDSGVKPFLNLTNNK